MLQNHMSLLTIIKKHNYYSPTRILIAFLNIYNNNIDLLDQDEEDSISDVIVTNLLEILSEYWTTTQCKLKLDNIKEGDIVKVFGYRKLSKVLNLKVTINNNTEDIIVATPF